MFGLDFTKKEDREKVGAGILILFMILFISILGYGINGWVGFFSMWIVIGVGATFIEGVTRFVKWVETGKFK